MYNLQIRSHKEIFKSREDALNYINENFKAKSLIGEPALAVYGTEDKPKMILCMGLGNSKIAVIDIDNVNESLNALNETNNSLSNDVVNNIQNITDIITSCGLYYDSNKIKNRITYNPDQDDNLISKAKSLSEAIDIISKYVQETYSDINLTASDSDSVSFSLTPNISSNGKVITGSVKLDDDESIILGKKGIKTNIDLSCDTKNNILSLKIGNILKQITLPGLDILKEVKYDKATKNVIVKTNSGNTFTIPMDDMFQLWVVDNKLNSPIILHRDSGVNGEPDKIYATLKLSSLDNLLSVDGNGNLSVNKNDIINDIDTISKRNDKELETKILDITDGNTQSINSLKEKVKSNEFKLGETNTISNTFDSCENRVLLSNVKISKEDGNIIKGLSDGLYANVTLSYDSSKNILYFDDGTDCVTEIQLVDNNNLTNVEYDEETKEIVFIFSDGCNPSTEREFRLDVKDLYNEIDVLNIKGSPIELTKTDNVGGKDIISATLKISGSTTNLIQNINGEIYASKLASAHSAIFDGQEKNLQEVINILKKRTEDNAISKNDIRNILIRLDSLDTITDNLRKDVGNKNDVADANGTLFGRVKDLRENIIETNNRFDEIETSIDNKISSLDKLDTEVDGEYVTSVSQENGIIDVKRKKLPINGVEENDNILSVNKNNLKSTLSLTVDSENQLDGKKYLRLKGINDKLIDKVDISLIRERIIDCGEY